MAEDAPLFTAIVLTAGGILLAVSCLASRLGSRLGVPVSLLFLGIGMLAGSDGPGGIWFNRFDIAYVLGTVALVVILFDGGLNTSLKALRGAVGPAVMLATVGVVGVAGLTTLGAWLLGSTWDEALLIGAIVSSTDAAAVFAVLHGVTLRGRIGPTIELESGLNDPVAVILTTAATAYLVGAEPLGTWMATSMLVQLALGVVFGVGVGYLGRALLTVPLSTPGLYPVLSLALAFLAYGATTLAGGSGFLAVYLCAIVLGNGRLPYELTLVRVHNSLAWLAQVMMFLMLGLLVFPSKLPPVAGKGLMLALYLAIVARPIAVTLCLLPFRFPWRETLCIAWIGLRGAVPIILATIPVLSAPGQTPVMREVLDVFDLVFFTVVVGSIIPGATVRWLPRVLGVLSPSTPAPAATVDITAAVPIRNPPVPFFVAPNSPAAGRTLGQLVLPDGASVMLIVRRNALIAPRGNTMLIAGDHAFVLCHHGSIDSVRQHFEPLALASPNVD